MMNSLFRSIVSLQQRLREAGVASAVIGGVAVGIWGEPRTTRDVDLKILLKRADAPRLLEIITPAYTPLQADPLAALTRNGVLFVQDALATRLDLLLTDTSFDAKAIHRAQKIELQPGLTAQVCSPEDLIIYKLISIRPRDHSDAESIIRRQGAVLDDKYVLAWLQLFEKALDDSTLMATYKRMRGI